MYTTSLHSLTPHKSSTQRSTYNMQRAMETPTDHNKRTDKERIKRAYHKKLARQRRMFELSKRMPPQGVDTRFTL